MDLIFRPPSLGYWLYDEYKYQKWLELNTPFNHHRRPSIRAGST